MSDPSYAQSMSDAATLERAHDDVNVVYDGPGLSSHTMDVRELAPALLGLSAVFQEANRVANPTAPDVALHIRATEPGCFDVDLQIVMDARDAGAVLLAGGAATALANAKTLVIDPVIGLISFILRRKKEPAVEPKELESGEIVYDWESGSITYPADVLRLSRSITVRRELETVVRPLESDDVDELRIKSSTTETITISRDDVPAFATTEGDVEPPVDQDIVTMTLSVVAPAFDRKKWRVSDGDRSYFVSILDEGFQDRIDAREAFAKGDFLRCRVRFAQYRANTATGLRMEREIIEVLEHSRPAEPPTLL